MLIDMDPLEWTLAILMFASSVGMLYLVVAALAALRFSRWRSAAERRRWAEGRPTEPVTILKPLCGAEAGLYENLRSYCLQNYGAAVQCVFGVRDADDPAIAVVRRVMAEFPDMAMDLVVDPRIYGTNFKVSNLINMMAVARHDVLVVADSDIRVGRDFLTAVTEPLADPAVGLVTCLYRAWPAVEHGAAALWSLLGAMWINLQFIPSVLLAEFLGSSGGCFGSTMVLRRQTLDATGGFAALRTYLADDFLLGAAVRKLGLRVLVSDYLIEYMVCERSFLGLFQHEVRWARTVRLLDPAGHFGTAVTHPLAWAILAAALAAATGQVDALIAGTLALAVTVRLVFTLVINRSLGVKADSPLLALPRDLLSFGILVTSFLGRRVAWRDHAFRVQPDGRLTLEGEAGQ